MNDAREEALRLAKEAGLSCNDYGQIYATGSGAVLIEDIVALIALARASAAPQEPVACALRKYTQSEADDNSEIWLVQLSPGQTLTEDQLLSYRAWKSVQEVPAAAIQRERDSK
jgi:hypothetical protein